MTREELEEGRALLTEFRTYEAKAIANGHSPEMLGAEIEGWLLDHAAELLSLAEEARWRDVASEPPNDTEQLVQVWHVSLHASGSPIAYSVNVARYGGGRWSLNMVTHWRPLPKGPER